MEREYIIKIFKEEPKMGLFDKLKNVFTTDNDYDVDDLENVDDFDVEMEEEKSSPSLKPRFMSINSDNIKKMENAYTAKETKVIIYEPKEYSEAANIVDSLKNKKIVVVNFANMKDNKEEGRNAQQCQKEIFDFINGAIYAIDGDIRKISDTIFVIAPPNVDIDSNINQEFEKKGRHRWSI